MPAPHRPSGRVLAAPAPGFPRHRLRAATVVVAAAGMAGLARAQRAPAQGPPHLSGALDVDPAAGTLRGDVCVGGLAPRRTRAFRLARGLNVREVHDSAGRVLRAEQADTNTDTDVEQYTFTDSSAAGRFCVAYVGAYPVYRVDAGESAATDWKGRIAFDGRTVRAAEQTRFYPVVVDSATGAGVQAVTYALTVTCAGCRALYMNGSAAAAGPRAAFTSATPRPLLLYAGDFPHATVGGVQFVGGPVPPADAGVIASGVRDVLGLHAAYLGVPFTDVPTFLTFASVSRDRALGETRWAFATWPTVALDGRVSFASLVDTAGGRRALKPFAVSLMAHEGAHFYFGTRYAPRGPLQWFLLESTAEYLALRTVRARLGDSVLAERLGNIARGLTRGGPFVPLDSVRAPGQIGEAYRYQLGPLLLFALERHIGADAVRRTLTGLVTGPPAGNVDYAAFRARVARAGGTEAGLRRFEAECLHATAAQLERGCLARPPAAGAAAP